MSVADILLRIIEQRRRRLGSVASGALPDMSLPTADASSAEISVNPFVEALAAQRGRAVIAEIKMGSPSLGNLGERVRPLEQARIYAESGAAALSVVVEPDFFFGSYELLAECKAACGLPAVAKDFLVQPLQIEQAAAAGADAVLLIAALYDRATLGWWSDLARTHGLVPLVETHGPGDAEKLAGREWELVGVNNRDLRTFRVDLDHSIEQVPRLPAGSLKVAESGIGGREDLNRLADAGFDAFLIGETLLLADDPATVLRELVDEGPEALRQ